MPKMFFKVDLIGAAFADAIVNTLWYTDDGSLAAPTIDDARARAQELVDELAAALPTLHKPLISSAVTFSRYDCRPYSPGGIHYSTTPLSTVVTGTGLHDGSLDGPAHTATLALAVTPGVILGGDAVYPVRRYLAIGPLANDQVGNDGALVMGGDLSAFNAFGSYVTSQVTGGEGTEFFPIGVAINRGPGVEAGDIGAYSNVVDFLWRPFASFRRSRMNRR